MIKKCRTIEPDYNTRLDILNHIKKNTFVDNNATINIGVVFHVCFQNYNKNDIDSDIVHVTNLLNKDFNKNADNFNSGNNVYKYKMPNISFIPYRTRYKYIRITRRLRRNRRAYRRAIRINRRRRRLNRKINAINRRRRRINRQRRALIRKYRNIYNNVTYFNKLYNNYISLADSANILFYHKQTIYHPLSPIYSENLNVIDNTVKINGSPPLQPSEYLNVWITDLRSGILGYAQFPWDNKPTTDGVVMSKYVFGRYPLYNAYNLNKTIVHEVGHWLGLYHTFQSSYTGQKGILDNNADGYISLGEKTGDLVSDTPPQNNPTYGNPFRNKLSWPVTNMDPKNIIICI